MNLNNDIYIIDTKVYQEEILALRDSNIAITHKSIQLKQILEQLCKEVTHHEAMQFSTLFARLVFIAQQYNLPPKSEWELQNFRVKVTEHIKKKTPIDALSYQRAERAILDLCIALSSERSTTNLQEKRISSIIETEYDTANITEQPKEKGRHIRVQIIANDTENYILYCAVEDNPSTQIAVRYNVATFNDVFTPLLVILKSNIQLNIAEYYIDNEGCIVPKIIVLEPDYLIDASALSFCFNNYSISPLHYFMNRFEIMENHDYLLLGNLANYFLDELVFADNPEELSFFDVFVKSFKQSPIEYATCQDIASNSDFKKFMSRAQQQFENIRRVIIHDFPRLSIDIKQCTLEPSFFSEKYGFQGRLDLLQKGDEDSPFHIIELKSGRIPFPSSNKGKIALNHEVQAIIYRLMIESVFSQPPRNIKTAILYSAANNVHENIRYTPLYQELEKEIINLRNQIVYNEYLICQGDIKDVEAMFKKVSHLATSSHHIPRFFIEKVERLDNTLIQCSSLERLYFYRFIQFISKELYLQKIGDVAHNSPVGVAALWNTSFWERAEALELLYDLTIDTIDDSDSDMKIVFDRNQSHNNLVNFREGDICIVYPRNSDSDNVLNKQILKGVIATINQHMVEVRFRYKQQNKAYFENNRLWAIEHDTLDSSYNSMYKSLFEFLNASREKRALLLGTVAPSASEANIDTTTPYTEKVIAKAMAAHNYFLIIGPPGTGKTSLFARRLVENHYANKTKNILILAYTNRAVDELCDAVNAAFGCASNQCCDKFIRIGSELSCNPSHRSRLLKQIASKVKNRSELLDEIANTRIFISTLSSISGRDELFRLKHFDIAIIDEASQVLEPQLIGVLSKVDKFILIGDHNQLSTIVLQNQYNSAIKEHALLDVGITDCSMSLFERLLHQCMHNQWEHAYAQLIHQGRMHKEIALFPSQSFYNNKLFPLLDWQLRPLQLIEQASDSLNAIVAHNRMVFFNTEHLIHEDKSDKINRAEAQTVAQLVESILNVYQQSNKKIVPSQIGVIAPYRNQIALIKQELAKANIPQHGSINVDTVERYQGSQRDIIILSFCVNKYYQLNFLCNLNAEGKVDRKLNVALTRARKQLFMIGNSSILKRHPIYASLLTFMKDKTVVLNKSLISK